MIWAVASRKGSPGATTLAVLLARAWPSSEPRVVIEADPDGGVLAARWHEVAGLTHEPGLLTLAAAREGSAADRLHRHAQVAAGGVRVVAAPPAPAQTEASLAALGDAAASAIAQASLTCFVDCGRLSPASPALAWARRAERVLMVARPRLDEVVALRPAAAALLASGLPVGLVCVGDHPFHPLEVAGQTGLALLGVIADDPVAATAIYRSGLDSRGVRRSRLSRSVAERAHALAAGDPAVPAEAPADPLVREGAL